MAPADDLDGPEPHSATSALGSTSLLMAVIVLMSAVGSFGAVRAWFPKVQTAPAFPSTLRPTGAAASAVPHDIDVPHVVDTPITAGRLSIVTDPPGARVEVDGRPRGLSPVVIDGLAAAEHRISVAADSGVAERTIAVSNGVMTEVVFSLPRPSAPVAGWIAIGSPFPVEMVVMTRWSGRATLRRSCSQPARTTCCCATRRSGLKRRARSLFWRVA